MYLTLIPDVSWTYREGVRMAPAFNNPLQFGKRISGLSTEESSQAPLGAAL
jgi:hypothetical protein